MKCSEYDCDVMCRVHDLSESDSSIEEEIEYSDDCETESSSYTGVSCYATVINQLAYSCLTCSISLMFLLVLFYKLLMSKTKFKPQSDSGDFGLN